MLPKLIELDRLNRSIARMNYSFRELEAAADMAADGFAAVVYLGDTKPRFNRVLDRMWFANYRRPPGRLRKWIRGAVLDYAAAWRKMQEGPEPKREQIRIISETGLPKDTRVMLGDTVIDLVESVEFQKITGRDEVKAVLTIWPRLG